MEAIILAAGQGTRLRPHTNDRPKCLVELQGASLLEHQAASLRAAGVDRITVVGGYRADMVRALGFNVVENEAFATTNMVESLMVARNTIESADDLLICYGDILYEPQVIEQLAGSTSDLSITANTEWEKLWRLRFGDPLVDAETLQFDQGHKLIDIGRKPNSLDEVEAQYMGLIALKNGFGKKLVAAYDAMDRAAAYDGRTFEQMYMTTFIRHLNEQVSPVTVTLVAGRWLEVDSAEELALYNRLADEGSLDEYWTPAA